MKVKITESGKVSIKLNKQQAAHLKSILLEAHFLHGKETISDETKGIAEGICSKFNCLDIWSEH